MPYRRRARNGWKAKKLNQHLCDNSTYQTSVPATWKATGYFIPFESSIQSQRRNNLFQRFDPNRNSNQIRIQS